jgi:hypothetical protein
MIDQQELGDRDLTGDGAPDSVADGVADGAAVRPTADVRARQEAALPAAALHPRVVAPAAWGAPTLLGAADAGALLLYAYEDLHHLLCWRLPDEARSMAVVVEFLPADHPLTDPPPPRADDPAPAVDVWVLPDDIDEQLVRYPARWGEPLAVIDGWAAGGPLAFAFADTGDGAHTLCWPLPDDTLLTLEPDDQL